MGDTLGLALGRVGRFLSQHYWNFEALAGLTADGRPLEHALSCFYETMNGAVSRSISVDYKDNYGPLPWEGIYSLADGSALEDVYGITGPDQVIDSRAELSLYHRYLKNGDEEESRALYADAGAKFFHAWKRFNKLSSPTMTPAGIPGISDVRINFHKTERFATDFAAPNSTSPFALELPRANLSQSEVPSDYFNEASTTGNTHAILSSIYDIAMKQLEKCDRLDCLVLFLASDTHWGTVLTDILDEILPEVPRTSALLYDIIDYKSPNEPSPLVCPNPLLASKRRKCSQMSLWHNIADRLSSYALLPLSYASISNYFRNACASEVDIETPGAAENGLRGNRQACLTDASAVMSLAVHSFVRQARTHTYRLSNVVDGLVPVSYGNILATGLNISLTGGFYEHTLDLSGLVAAYLQSPIDSSFAAARSFCIDPLDLSAKPRGWVNSYVKQYAELFRQPIIRNSRGLLLRGPVLQLPDAFPHIFTQRCGLSYRTELPIAVELRNTPYYYANLCATEKLIQGRSSFRDDNLELEDTLQYLCVLKDVYKPSRHLAGIEISDDRSGSEQ